MMRNGGLANAQSPPQLARAKTGAVRRITFVREAAFRETQENRQPVRMGQRLEHRRRFSSRHLLIIIDISINIKPESAR